MRRLLISLLFSLMIAAVGPRLAAQQVSADQLEHMVAQWQGLPDGEAAAKIADLQLTERFSSVRLAKALSGLPGPKAQRALFGVADQAVFLAPSTAEIPAMAAPDVAQQRKIMGQTAAYVTNAVRQLPRFSALRTVTHFESAPSGSVDSVPTDFGALHAIRLSRSTVEYREGEEIVDAGPAKTAKSRDVDQGLRTWGVFGPILSLVLMDAAQNQLTWSRWEQGGNGPLAVFRYSVPRGRSHYEIHYCCSVHSYGFESSPFNVMSGYHGEMAVDPTSGAIIRLVLQADLQPHDPISRADLMVEYGPVELGGKTYICPQRSVSASVARTLRTVQDASGRGFPTMGPPQLLLNHSEFGQYHLFHTDLRVLSHDEERAAGTAPDATLPPSEQADAQPSEEVLADSPAAATSSGAVAIAGTSEAPEITAGKAAPLPDAAARAQEQQSAGQAGGAFTLQLNARLVDVNVVVLDKKGRPISGLKPEDFEVYDNGVKQQVKSFNLADAGATEMEAAAPVRSIPTSFSNHAEPKAQDAGTTGSGNLFVFVIDPANMVWNDLVDARRQMLDFLRKLPGNERVALYVMRYHGFQVLEEATTDHAWVADTLRKWMPSAQDLLNARDQEDRNRQKIEYVHSPEDLLSANGGYILDSQTQQVALDPQMRELGSNPGPNALDTLVEIAHHLAPRPGHKSLVWLTSDNALADWNRMSVTIEKHAKYIEPIALRTQEAMNNAHVSVYPLDASRLEANVINAEIGNRNVELTPTYQMPAAMEHEEEGPEVRSGIDINQFGQNRDLRPGRLTAQMQQDLRPIEGVFREIAEATGGKAFRRSSNIEGELNGVVAESHATYLLGFTPAQAADGQYHRLMVKLVGHRDATLRYRTGYQYDKEPITLKDRFAKAVWQPTDLKEIAISAQPVTDAGGHALRVTVAGSDLDLTQQNLAAGNREIWSGKLDIFLVQRDEMGQRAHVTGQTVGLHLKPSTYQHAVSDGLTFDQRIELKPKADVSLLRVVVVDLNSGRIGSVSVPASALAMNSN